MRFIFSCLDGRATASCARRPSGLRTTSVVFRTVTSRALRSSGWLPEQPPANCIDKWTRLMADTARGVKGNQLESKPWGASDEKLATRPLAFRDNLLAGQTFLISGGGSGLGRAIAYVCVRPGANVVICGRRAQQITETAHGIRTRFGRGVGSAAVSLRDSGPPQ